MFSYNKYSTEEVNTGKTWIDGKPIYRKVYYADSITSSGSNPATYSVGPAPANINVMTKLEGVFDSNNQGYFMPLCNASYFQASYSHELVVYNNTNVEIYNGKGGTLYKVMVVLEYTKTTDQATV